MFKLLFPISAAALALAATFATPAAPAAAALGPDAARCRSGSGEPAILVAVNGFKNRVGALRVQVYDSPEDFMVRGKWLRRVDVPLTGNGPMEVCVAVSRPGAYAVVVRHDADANRKTGWNDGAGYSNNPRLSLFNLKPPYSRVAVRVGNGVKPIAVVLNYRQGLAVRPLAS